MSTFTGTLVEYEALKKALVQLHDVDKINSPTLLRRLAVYAKTDEGKLICSTGLPHYSALDRLRGAKDKGDSSQLIHRARNESFAHLVWSYIKKTWPTLIRDNERPSLTDPFYDQLNPFYDAGGSKSAARLSNMKGRYEIHHFSERLREPPHAIVRGEMFIDELIPGEVFTSRENQFYDGKKFHLGQAEEHNEGYCLLKHTNLFIVLHETQSGFATPKWYLFDVPVESNVMTGRMFQLVPGRSAFSSTVFARKISETKQLDMNIFSCSEIEKRVMARLLTNDFPGFYELKEIR